MEASVTDFLNQPHLVTIQARDEGDAHRVEAAGQVVPRQCPACGHSGLHGHGRQRQQFMDLPLHGKGVLIKVKRKRFRCTVCGKTLFSSLPDMEGRVHGAAGHLLGPEFTLRELQDTFEIVLGREVDKSAFRRRIRDAGIIEPIPGKKRYGSNRPAQLYRAKLSDRLHYFSRPFEKG